jgi:hypothetical protein
MSEEEIKIEEKKYCPFNLNSNIPCDKDCKWNIKGDCIIVLLVESLNRLNQILYNMYHHEKYERKI